jgi:Dolichyl-phosphate-mannose-protein mannosyltransferase
MILLAPRTFSALRWKRPRVTAATGLVLLVGLGLALRLYHFLRMPSVWHDEAALLINVVRLDFHEMLGPLLIHEAAPPLFLMIERAMMLLFGDGIVALRMFPFLVSCASVVLVALLARRLLTPDAAMWAVGLFAVSDRLLWHAVEAKPYSVDVFVAVAVAYGYVTTRHWQVWRQCLLAAAVLPIILWLSFPACFVVGGWFAAQLPALLRSRSSRDWIGIIAVAGLVAGSFIWLAEGPAKAQRDGAMESCWTTGFPDWQRPWLVPVWVVRSTIDIFCYCIPPQGWACVGVVVAGGAWVYRQGQARFLALMFVPMGLTLIAALAGKYPYCGMRVLAYMTPAFCLLAGAGVEPMTALTRERFAAKGLVILWIALAIPFLNTSWRLVDHWPRADIDSGARYVLGNWQTTDAVGFNHWEGQYYFRHMADRWLEPDAAFKQPPGRIWYLASSMVPAEREEILKRVPPGWRLVERREYKFVIVGLFVPEENASPSTSDARLVP